MPRPSPCGHGYESVCASENVSENETLYGGGRGVVMLSVCANESETLCENGSACASGVHSQRRQPQKNK